MRNYTVALLILLSSTIYSKSIVAVRQAVMSGTPTYELTGKAYLEEFDDGTFQFRLDSNYATTSGPDVQIFLTNNSSFSSPIDTTSTLMVENIGSGFGGISHFSGAYSKAISLNSLDDFNHLVFVCVRFGSLYWGHGSYASKQVITSTGNATKKNVQVYPNPSTGFVNIAGEEPMSAQLFGSKGEFIRSLESSTGNDLSSLPKGVYWIRLILEGEIINKRIVLQ